MTKELENFDLYQGTTLEVTIPCVDDDGNPLNMTGGVGELHLLDDPSRPTSAALISKTGAQVTFVNVSPGTGNGFRFTLAPADSKPVPWKRYWHEARVKDSQNNEAVVANGWVTVKPSPSGRD